MVDPGDTRLPLAPSGVDIEANIREIQSQYPKAIADQIKVLDSEDCFWATMTEEEWNEFVTTTSLGKYLLATNFFWNQIPGSYVSVLIKGFFNKWKKFADRVQPGGKWDFRKYEEKDLFEDFGNYHFGIMAAAIGINICTALAAGGLVKAAVDIQNSKFPTGDMQSYLDDARDSKWIQEGMKAYFSKEYKKIKYIPVQGNSV